MYEDSNQHERLQDLTDHVSNFTDVVDVRVNWNLREQCRKGANSWDIAESGQYANIAGNGQ